MERALALAAYAAEQDEVPIGAVVVNPENGEIISEAYNLSEHVADASAHAEILAIRKACEKLKCNRLRGMDLYVTLEPCTMCAAAISFASKTFISARLMPKAAPSFPASNSMTARLVIIGRKFRAALWSGSAGKF